MNSFYVHEQEISSMNIEKIKESLNEIQKNIEKACDKVRRSPSEIQIIVVTRNRQVPEIREAVEAGCRILGESRVQEAVQKISFFESNIQWHLVGHLQSVKAKTAIETFRLIHTVDNLRIGFDLQRACEQLNKPVDILIHVNTTEDEKEFGIEPSETLNLIKELIKFPLVHIRGLMTQVPPLEDSEQVRPFFKRLRELRDRIRDAAIPGVDMTLLSMGTSQDYMVAIQEGSNILRITSPIFPEEK